MVSFGPTLPQLRARKVVFIPLLIPQPDWEKYQLFFGMIPYLILRVTGLDSASAPIPVNVEHCARTTHETQSVVLILKTSVGWDSEVWYLWDFDCLIPGRRAVLIVSFFSSRFNVLFDQLSAFFLKPLGHAGSCGDAAARPPRAPRLQTVAYSLHLTVDISPSHPVLYPGDNRLLAQHITVS